MSLTREAVHFRAADDSVTVADLPAGLGIYPAYIDGIYANAAKVRRRFPHALVPTITVNGHDAANIVDQENGDATPATAASWSLTQHRAGAIPTEYFSVAQLKANLEDLHQLGLGANDVVFWTAHYTGTPHICGPACWRQYGWGKLPFTPKIIGTQYDDKGPHGEHYDRSLFAAYWPGVDPAPATQKIGFRHRRALRLIGRWAPGKPIARQDRQLLDRAATVIHRAEAIK